MTTEVSTVPLSVILRNDDRAADIYLILNGERPIELGNGRFAVVWLAANGKILERSDLYAVKLVRKIPDSVLANAVTRWRFFEEMLKTWDHGTSEQDGMVKF